MVHAAVDGRGLYAMLSQLLHLVLHQCDKRSDYHAYAMPCKCRHLEGDALATTGGHQSQRVVAAHDALNDFPLDATEVLVAPVSLQYGTDFRESLLVHHFSLVAL